MLLVYRFSHWNDTSCSNWPGYRVLLTARFFISALLGSPRSVKYIYREMFWVWKNKHNDFEEHGVDIISGVSICAIHEEAYSHVVVKVTILPRLRTALFVADPVAIKV